MIVKFFDDYSSLESEARYKAIDGDCLKILTPKHMLQRFPIALTQIKGRKCI